MSPLLTTIFSTTSLVIALIALTISAVSAYRTHFRKHVSLILNTYDDVFQEDADVVMLLTNQGNVSLAIPWIQVGRASRDGMKSSFMFRHSKSASSQAQPYSLIETRSSSRVVKPGDHLEFLLKVPKSEGEEMIYLKFETVTAAGVSFYFEQHFSHRFSVRLTPAKRRVTRPSILSGEESCYMDLWKCTELDGYYRRIPFIGRVLNMILRRKSGARQAVKDAEESSREPED